MTAILPPELGTRLAMDRRDIMAAFLTRRQLRDVFVLAPSWIGLFPRVSGRTFRVAIHASVDADARRGIELATIDADQKARLLGASVEINNSTADAAGLAGVVIGADGSSPRSDVPIVCVSAEPVSGSGVFSVGPTAENRRAALLAWRATHAANDGDDLELVEWHERLTVFGAADLNERFARHHRLPMSPAAWRGYFAVKALAENALRRATASDRRRTLLEGEFDGHKGKRLKFDRATRVLRQPLYVVRREEFIADIVGEIR